MKLDKVSNVKKNVVYVDDMIFEFNIDDLCDVYTYKDDKCYYFILINIVNCDVYYYKFSLCKTFIAKKYFDIDDVGLYLKPIEEILFSLICYVEHNEMWVLNERNDKVVELIDELVEVLRDIE